MSWDPRGKMPWGNLKGKELLATPGVFFHHSQNAYEGLCSPQSYAVALQILNMSPLAIAKRRKVLQEVQSDPLLEMSKYHQKF
jgi:hypothetical protein